MIRFKCNFGKGTMEIEGKDIAELCENTAAISIAAGKKCECGSERIYPYHRNVDNNDFYSLRCADCGAELKISQRKKGGFFVRDEAKFEKYTPKSQPPA